MDLQDLFSELSEETQASQTDIKDDITQVKESVSRLPKIDAKLSHKVFKKDVITMNDPLVVPRPKTTQEELDKAKWFNMGTPEMTDELKRDLMILKQRAALDPKRHYKKEKWEIPNQFQMGEIVEGNTTYYNRLSRKQKGRTLAQEILNDDHLTSYFDRKHKEIRKKQSKAKKGEYRRRRF